MLQDLKKILLFIFITSSFCFFAAPTTHAANLNNGTLIGFTSLSETQIDIFGRNNILFYDPNGGCRSGGGGAGLVAGDSVEEKIWNYFVQLNIPGVSDNAAVISGIMGNLKEESGYDPFVGNGKYCGVYATYCSTVQSIVGSDYSKYGHGGYGDLTKSPEDAVVKALEAELKQLTQDNPRFAKDFISHLDKVTNTTGEAGAASYAELFEVEVERAVCSADMSSCHSYSQPLEDQVVQKYVNNELYRNSSKYHNTPYQGVAHRREHAKEIYNKYASSTSSPQSTVNSSSSGSTLHAPSGDGWLSSLSGWEKKELGPNSGGCTHYDSNITDGYIPESGNGTGLPQYIVLHYTEGEGLADYCDADSNAVVAPHFTIDLVNKKIYQHFPLTSPSGAVSEGEGKWDRWGVQIEIMGCGGMSSYKEPCSAKYTFSNFGDEQWDYLAALLIEIAKQTGIPLNSSLDWSKSNRLTTSAMKSYVGVLGHQHVQGNDHSDPGPIWDKVKAAIDRNPDYSVGCSGNSSSGVNYCAPGKDCTSDGFTVYSQGDARWNGNNSKWGTMGSNGCGPSAFATAATNLLRKKITPGEVADYMCSSGLTCGSAMPRGNAPQLAEHYGLEFKDLTDEVKNTDPVKAEKTINEYLKAGWIIQGVFTGCFTASSGHYLLIRGVTSDGRWKIATNTRTEVSSCSGYIGSSNLQNEVEWIPQDYIVKNIKGNTTFALRSSNSGACIGVCSEQSNAGQLMAGGFKTEEEADRAIMQPYHDLYKGNKSDSKKGPYDSATMSQYGIVPTESCAAGPPYNCVSFSLYFLNKYTNLSSSVISGLGDGHELAKNLASKYNLKNDSTPELYSIFSWSNNGYGHTGVVLGIIDDSHILVGESSCQSNGSKQKAISLTGAHIYEKVKDGQWKGKLTSSATDWNFTHIPISNIKGI